MSAGPSSRKRTGWRFGGGSAVVASLAVCLFLMYLMRMHGHSEERLEVTVRIVDARTAQPIDGALVVVCRHGELANEYLFERSVARALTRPEQNWGVAAFRTTAAEVARFRAVAYETSYNVGPIRYSREAFGPNTLLIDHPRYGRRVFSIDPELVEADGDRWRTDFGTFALPRTP